MQPRSVKYTRRSALLAGFAAILAPRMAFADAAAVSAALKQLYADKPMAAGRIKLDLPAIAENGMSVPLAVSVDSPMSEQDHVKTLHVFADGNPLPVVASYRFTPACGRAAIAIRMRLAQSQTIICVAEMSDGSLFTAKAAVSVTVGGCSV
ncbi:thiosulfate oxidation carrier protein SoxY [Ferrovibrio sp.]|uniref:thiosulfate oxidation carrier protein SoxY n=1 Tax=Ferrovibrio sp. TaxID=1917215 RepID=UPI0025B86882|nr:thiosulfate oxidation carrier protein SoxY [Ferrovibrio sp.]MBX3454522.1 thiosulfate oxidation carrier protein SoxY [Ferrovibrio sp.]